MLKYLFRPFFASELAELDALKISNAALKSDYDELVNNYNTLGVDYNKLLANPNSVEVIKEVIKEVAIVPREFESATEMLNWFKQNKQNEKKYVTTIHDCEDFAIETQLDALVDGYIVNLELDMDGTYYGNGVAHMLCGCKVGNRYYVVEPQTDAIVTSCPLD